MTNDPHAVVRLLRETLRQARRATNTGATDVRKEIDAALAAADALLAAPVEPVAGGEASYQEHCREVEAELADEPADLPATLRMLERWGPEALPANENGQVPFARALLDSAASAIRKHLASPPTSTDRAAYERGVLSDDALDQLAMQIAVNMEVHAALSTTTRAKANDIAKAIRTALLDQPAPDGGTDAA